MTLSFLLLADSLLIFNRWAEEVLLLLLDGCGRALELKLRSEFGSQRAGSGSRLRVEDETAEVSADVDFFVGLRDALLEGRSELVRSRIKDQFACEAANGIVTQIAARLNELTEGLHLRLGGLEDRLADGLRCLLLLNLPRRLRRKRRSR